MTNIEVMKRKSKETPAQILERQRREAARRSKEYRARKKAKK
jgi:hypothetical protein